MFQISGSPPEIITKSIEELIVFKIFSTSTIGYRSEFQLSFISHQWHPMSHPPIRKKCAECPE